MSKYTVPYAFSVPRRLSTSFEHRRSMVNHTRKAVIEILEQYTLGTPIRLTPHDPPEGVATLIIDFFTKEEEKTLPILTDYPVYKETVLAGHTPTLAGLTRICLIFEASRDATVPGYRVSIRGIQGGHALDYHFDGFCPYQFGAALLAFGTTPEHFFTKGKWGKHGQEPRSSLARYFTPHSALFETRSAGFKELKASLVELAEAGERFEHPLHAHFRRLEASSKHRKLTVSRSPGAYRMPHIFEHSDEKRGKGSMLAAVEYNFLNGDLHVHVSRKERPGYPLRSVGVFAPLDPVHTPEDFDRVYAELRNTMLIPTLRSLNL